MANLSAPTVFEGVYDYAALSDASALAKREWRQAEDCAKSGDAQQAHDYLLRCAMTLARAGAVEGATFACEAAKLANAALRWSPPEKREASLAAFLSLTTPFYRSMDRLFRGHIQPDHLLMLALRTAHKTVKVARIYPDAALTVPALPSPIWSRDPSLFSIQHGRLTSLDVSKLFSMDNADGKQALTSPSAVFTLRAHFLSASHSVDPVIALGAFSCCALLEEFCSGGYAAFSTMPVIYSGAQLYASRSDEKRSEARLAVDAASFCALALRSARDCASRATGSQKTERVLWLVGNRVDQALDWGLFRPTAIEDAWSDFTASFESAFARNDQKLLESSLETISAACKLAGSSAQAAEAACSGYARAVFGLPRASRDFAAAGAFDLQSALRLASRSQTMLEANARFRRIEEIALGFSLDGPKDSIDELQAACGDSELYDIPRQASRESKYAQSHLLNGNSELAATILKQTANALEFAVPVWDLATAAGTLLADLSNSISEVPALGLQSIADRRSAELCSLAFCAAACRQRSADDLLVLARETHQGKKTGLGYFADLAGMAEEDIEWSINALDALGELDAPCADSLEQARSIICGLRLFSAACGMDAARLLDDSAFGHQTSMSSFHGLARQALRALGGASAPSPTLATGLDEDVLRVVKAEAPKMMEAMFAQASDLAKGGQASDLGRQLHSLANMGDLIGARRLALGARALESWRESGPFDEKNTERALSAIDELALLIERACILDDGGDMELPSIDAWVERFSGQIALRPAQIEPLVPTEPLRVRTEIQVFVPSDALESEKDFAPSEDLFAFLEASLPDQASLDKPSSNSDVPSDMSDLFEMLEASLLSGNVGDSAGLPPALSNEVGDGDELQTVSGAASVDDGILRIPYYIPESLVHLTRQTIAGLPDGTLSWPSASEPGDDVEPGILQSFMGEATDIVASMEKIVAEFVPGASSFKELNRQLHTIKGGARMSGAMRLGHFIHGLEELTLKEVSDIPKARAMAKACSVAVQATRETLDVLAKALGEHIAALAGSEFAQNNAATAEEATFRIKASQITSASSMVAEVSRSNLRAQTHLDNALADIVNLSGPMDRMGRAINAFTGAKDVAHRLSEALADFKHVGGQARMRLLAANDQVVATRDLAEEARASVDSIGYVDIMTMQARARAVARQAMSDTGKSAKLHFVGEVKVERQLLDMILPPIEHILRNALAHGIEPLPSRRLAGKPDDGNITFTASQDGQFIDLLIQDDGAGVNLAAVERKARSNGLILDSEKDPGEARLLSMLFEPGFSTAEAVNQIAGRGVGLDVVSDAMTRLGGRVVLTSKPGEGACFQLRVPMSSTHISGALFYAGDERCPYIVPSGFIDRIDIISAGELRKSLSNPEYKAVIGSGATAARRRVVWIGTLAGIDENPRIRSYNKAVLVFDSDYAIFSESIETVSQASIQAFPDIVPISSGLIATSLLHDGATAIVIEPTDAIATQRKIATAGMSPSRSHAKPVVVVADDSITARESMAKSLGKMGYRCIQAENGLECLSVIAQLDYPPHAVILDDDMPVMNGVQCAEAIRQTSKLDFCVLVMASSSPRSSLEARLSGIRIDAFVDKPFGFDLLEKLIRRANQEALA